MMVIVNERAVNNSPPSDDHSSYKMIYILPLSEEALYSGTEHSDLL